MKKGPTSDFVLGATSSPFCMDVQDLAVTMQANSSASCPTPSWSAAARMEDTSRLMIASQKSA